MARDHLPEVSFRLNRNRAIMEDLRKTAKGGDVPLQGPPWSVRSEQAASSFPPLKLVVQPSGPVLELTRPDMLIGRHSESDLRLPLPDVSRHHCRLVFADGAWQVVDLDSLNGVVVNGQRVKRATLQHRDSVVIGSFRFEVELGSNPNSSPETSAMLGNADDVIRNIAGSLLPAPTDTNAAYRKAS